MKNISIFFTLVLTVCASLSYGQQLKTYTNKNYETSCGVPGTLTYSYYEGSNGDYVKHGKYTVSASETLPKYWSRTLKDYVTRSTKYSATANFKDGWLNGTVTVTVTTTEATASKKGTSISSLTANFKDGMPHGAWKMTRTTDGKKTYSISANFSNGVLVGSFELNDYLKGQFDEDGFYTGKWIGKSGDDYEYNFINGVYVSLYERKDGKVIWSLPENEDEKELYKKFAERQMTREELEESGYSVKITSANLLGTEGPEFMNTILYKGNDCFGLSAIGGDKTLDRKRSEKRVMGKYIRITKERDVKVFKAGEFERYAKKIENLLKNEFFEDKEQLSSAKVLWEGYSVSQGQMPYQYRSYLAKELWESYRVSQEQKDLLTNLYNQYIQEWRPAKLQRVEEEKRLAEEARQKEIEKAFNDFASAALDKIVSVSSKRADMKIFGPETVIAVDYDNDRIWSELFSSRSSLRDKIGKQLKDFCPAASYKIDSVDVANGTVYCTIEKYNKKEGSQYWQTQLVFNSTNIDLDQSFVFNKAVRVRGDWDEIRDLQQMIENNKNKIIEQAGKDYSDVVKSYNSEHKDYNLKVSDDLKETISRLNNFTKIQHGYMKFIDLRGLVANKHKQIMDKCSKDYADVAKAYSSYLKGYNVAISSDTNESYKRLNDLMTVQDNCANFIDLRKVITENNSKLSNNKSAKNIVKVYSTYMKSVDLTWTSESNCCDKLQKAIDIQKQFQTAVSSSNAAELDLKVKKLKDKSVDNVLKELK